MHPHIYSLGLHADKWSASSTGRSYHLYSVTRDLGEPQGLSEHFAIEILVLDILAVDQTLY
jgi:hypothetical protein